jgi:threonine/homoserine/homoserine lactone efflux protein
VGVVYLSVMPQFLPDGLNPLVGSLALAAIHVGEGFVWLTLVVVAVDRASGWLARPNVRRRLEQITGVVFLGFGLRLALERAP